MYMYVYVPHIDIHTKCAGSKRRHSDDSCPDGSSTRFSLVPKSEVWSLRDVIFTDHVTNVKVGSVVKLDGNYVAVHYPALNPDELSAANLDKCRLLRKDELVVRLCNSRQWKLYIKNTLRLAIFVLKREVSSSRRLKSCHLGQENLSFI